MSNLFCDKIEKKKYNARISVPDIQISLYLFTNFAICGIINLRHK